MEQKSLGINISGINLSFVDNNTSIDYGIYKHFLSKQGERRFRIHLGEVPKFKRKELIFKGGYLWRVYKNNSKYVIDCSTNKPYFYRGCAVLSKDLKRGDIYLRRYKYRTQPLICQLPPVDKILFLNISGLENRIMLHGLGIIDRGKAIAFIGAPGAGKSTLANIFYNANGITVLNDDRIITRRRNNKILLYGTPWYGEFKSVSGDSAVLSHIFFMEQAKQNSIVPMTYIEAFRYFFSQVFMVYWNKEILHSCLSLSEDILKHTTFSKLRFVNKQGVVDFVRRYLERIEDTTRFTYQR